MLQKARLHIDGMTCQACASRIEKVLNKKDFEQHASVNFANEEAQIEFDNSQTDLAALIGIIEKTGFSARQQDAAIADPAADEAHIGWRLWLLFAINVPFLVGMLGMMIGKHNWMMPPLWQFALASVVQLWLAIPFYRSAWASIKGGLANMDVLVSLGTSAIYLYSVFMLFRPHQMTAHHAPIHVYFEAGVMVIGFVSLGKFLEHRAKKHSLNSLGLLLQLTPKQVQVQKDGQWHTQALDQVQIGDILRVNSGERVAADGIVMSGTAWADESHLTGESQPESKQMGSRVLAGAMVNDGSIVYRAEQLGSATLLGDMMNALAEAQGSKAPIARIADKVAAVFVPIVVGIALITFALTWGIQGDWVQALMNAVAVLVIACPCALGLATPAAIMVGMGKAVKLGVWFKDAAAMERASQVNTVVLDKTGTLTEGKPQVAAIWLAHAQISETQLLQAAAAVEALATHPLARAIVQTAQQRNLTLPTANHVCQEAGAGIRAEVEGIGTVLVGKADFCQVTLPTPEGIWQLASVVAVSINGKAAGAFALADTLKNDSLRAIQRLQQHHIDVYIMSGDQASAVAHIAQQLGIHHAQGGMTPRDKAHAVQTLKQQGKVVAMVGDGINDAPALAAADVSFAMHGGADVATHTASATLMQHSVNQMVDALLVSQATMTHIKQNLFFAFFYNVLGIPLAAFGLLNPILAGAAMAMSSISVLGNALRLKRAKID